MSQNCRYPATRRRATFDPMNTDTISLGLEIKNQRTVLALTQDDLAKMAEINIRTIQRAEKGVKIGAYTLRKILETLGLDVPATLKKFNHLSQSTEEASLTRPDRAFNPDRWFAEFQLRKAKLALWRLDIEEEAQELKAKKNARESDWAWIEFAERLEELDWARYFYLEECAELAKEEDAIHAFDWQAWQTEKEMELLEKEREEEEFERQEKCCESMDSLP